MHPGRVRFRHHSALAVAALIVLVSGVPLATAAPYLWMVLLVPLAVAVWAWRSGTDADASGLRVRALIGDRRLPWSQVDAIVPTARGRVAVRLVDGGSVALTAVTAADLPRLIAASGQSTDPGGSVQ
ncbi:MAG TPA: PH domain-containing protein [Micromonosporaceae bacterium]|nr:PH domain-containing protein [Micromonosporaceae bacterium]